MAHAPTFLLCVGATKAGTSWLFEHLATHPDCHVRSVKELHFFDPPGSALPRTQMRSNNAEIARLTARLAASSSGSDDVLRRRIADMAAWNAVLSRGSADLAAYRDYLTEGLAAQRVVVDVTPSYALLSVPELRRLIDVASDVRIVYLMRDPVARLWSHVRMLAAREAVDGQDVATLAHARMDRALAGTDLYFGGRGDYRSCLERLRAVFAPRNLLALFTEDMMTLPGIARLWAHLGIGPGPVAFENRVHEGVRLPLSSAHRDRARLALRDQYDYAVKAFPTLPSAWSANMIGSVA